MSEIVRLIELYNFAIHYVNKFDLEHLRKKIVRFVRFVRNGQSGHAYTKLHESARNCTKLHAFVQFCKLHEIARDCTIRAIGTALIFGFKNSGFILANSAKFENFSKKNRFPCG